MCSAEANWTKTGREESARGKVLFVRNFYVTLTWSDKETAAHKRAKLTRFETRMGQNVETERKKNHRVRARHTTFREFVTIEKRHQQLIKM